MVVKVLENKNTLGKSNICYFFLEVACWDLMYKRNTNLFLFCVIKITIKW